MIFEQIEVSIIAILDMHLRKSGVKEGLAMRQGNISKETWMELIIKELPQYGCTQLCDIYGKLGLEKGEKNKSVLGGVKMGEKNGRIGVKRYPPTGQSKSTILYRPEVEDGVRLNNPKYFETKKEIPLPVKQQHTNDEKVLIRRWIEEILDISIDYSRGHFGIFGGKAYRTLELMSVEQDPLFPSLEPDLPFKNDLFEKWEDFKERHNGYEKGKREIYSSICKKLSDELQIEVSDKWQDRELIHCNFPDLIYRSLIELAKDDEGNYNSLLSFESRVGYEEKTGLGRYWVNANGLVIVKMNESEEELKDRMDNYVRSTIEGLRGSRFERKMIKLKDLEEPMNGLKEDILYILGKNLKVPLFGGECEICRKLKTIL